MPVDTRDHYTVLGVPRTAPREDVQRAYRTLARRHHPDVNREPGAEERFKEIAEAYQVLSDPRRRHAYDATRATVDDLLGSLFQGGLGRSPAAEPATPPVPGADSQAEFAVGVEDAYRGARRTITLPGPAGRPRQYTVDIPAGVSDGQRIRLAGQGAPGGHGGPPGDLYLVVRLSPHPRYKVDGRDIMVDLPASPWEAALGASVPVQTPGGPVRLDVPPGSSSGRRLRLRGQGLPNPRGIPGDLYAEVRIVVPATLSQHERDLYTRLAAASTVDPRSSP